MKPTRPEKVNENPEPKENYNYADRSLLQGFNQCHEAHTPLIEWQEQRISADIENSQLG